MKSLAMFLAAAGLLTGAAVAQSVDSTQPAGRVSAQAKSRPVAVIAGAINANGTAQLSPTTFTVAHPSTGRYIITFTAAFAKDALCVYQPVGASVRVGALSVSKTTCDVTFFSNSSNAVADILFVFMATNAG